MCTASWVYHPSGFHLFFNRDELHARSTAKPPSIHEQGNCKAVYPVDPDSGGTWIAVNEAGFVFFLLNYYHSKGTSAAVTLQSRGGIIPALACITTEEGMRDQLKSFNSQGYTPFTLVVIHPRTTNEMVLTWNGKTSRLQTTKKTSQVLSSSSYDTEKVLRSRRDLFYRRRDEKKLEKLSAFEDYHKSHVPSKGAYSVCMHRGNGETKSFSHIIVREAHVVFEYFEGSPCQAKQPFVTELGEPS